MVSLCEYLFKSNNYTFIKHGGQKWAITSRRQININHIRKMTSIMNNNIILFFDDAYKEYIIRLYKFTYKNQHARDSVIIHTNYNVYCILSFTIVPLNNDKSDVNRLLEILLTGSYDNKTYNLNNLGTLFDTYGNGATNININVKWINSFTKKTIDIATSSFEQQLKFWLDGLYHISPHILESYKKREIVNES
jgi:hypothetical protein